MFKNGHRLFIFSLCLFFFSLNAHSQSKRPPLAQIEFLSPTEILDYYGQVNIAGWAKSPLFIFDKNWIPKRFTSQLKEWEHYTLMSKDFGASITISHIGMLAFAAIDFIDFKRQKEWGNIFWKIRKKEEVKMPMIPFETFEFKKRSHYVTIKQFENHRKISFKFGNKIFMPKFQGSMTLRHSKKDELLAVVTPFKNPYEFFYELKAPGVQTNAKFKIGRKKYSMGKDSFSIMDWGRGVWPKSANWKWGQATGFVKGKQVSFNISYDYGKDTYGTANSLFVDGKLIKLGRMSFVKKNNQRNSPYRVRSSNGNIELNFKPLYHQKKKFGIGKYKFKLSKKFGTFDGKVFIPGEGQLKIRNFRGFLEAMEQKW